MLFDVFAKFSIEILGIREGAIDSVNEGTWGSTRLHGTHRNVVERCAGR